MSFTKFSDQFFREHSQSTASGIRDIVSLPKEHFLFLQVTFIEDIENILYGINEGLGISKIGSLFDF